MSKADREGFAGVAAPDAGSDQTRRRPRTLPFVWAYLKANLAMEMEYRAAFFAQILSMAINDGMWVAFWVLYFTRFPVVEGWGRADVLALWAIVATGYGVGNALFGNVLRLSQIIYSGGLDVYLTQPRSVFLHVLVSRTWTSAWGDVLFGAVVFFWLCEPTLARTGLFLLGSLLAGIIIIAFFAVVQSLAFFIGNADTTAAQLSNALIHFATYPTSIFQGGVKLILFTAIPAGFVSYMPIGLMRKPDPVFIAGTFAAAAVLTALAILVFRAGLRRYESGNLVTTRL